MAIAPQQDARKALAIVAAQAEAAEDFTFFLRYARIRSDDPSDPAIIPWQQWPYLVDRARAWSAGESEVVLKARQLGMTWLLSYFLAWKARNGGACGVFSVGQREAREVLRRIRLAESMLPQWLQIDAEFNADEVRYPSGGSVHAFPSTEQAGISYTFQVAAMDEAAFHPYAAFNYAALRPTLSAGGQFLALSTADPTLGPSGFFHDLYWASTRGETPYRAVFIPWDARPGRDEAWLRRERAAYQGLPEEFDAYYPDSDAAAFVARSGLVFPQFSTVRHVRLPDTPLSDAIRVVAGVDFGGGDPTAVVVLGLDRHHKVHQYAEFYKRGAVSLDEIGGFLKRYPVGVVVCDPSQGVAIETLRHTYGLPARAADNKRGEGLGMVSFLLDNDRLTIDPSCVDSIAEFPGYRWATRVDSNDKTRFATTTPVDHHADAMDARRYAVLEITAMLHASVGPRIRRFDGRRPARKAV